MNQRLGCHSQSRGHIIKMGKAISGSLQKSLQLLLAWWQRQDRICVERGDIGFFFSKRTKVVMTLLPSQQASWKGQSDTPFKWRVLLSHWCFGLAQWSLAAVLTGYKQCKSVGSSGWRWASAHFRHTHWGGWSLWPSWIRLSTAMPRMADWPDREAGHRLCSFCSCQKALLCPWQSGGASDFKSQPQVSGEEQK